MSFELLVFMSLLWGEVAGFPWFFGLGAEFTMGLAYQAPGWRITASGGLASRPVGIERSCMLYGGRWWKTRLVR